MDLSRDSTLAASLTRCAQSGIAVSSIINIGAGSGKDTLAVERFFPGSHTLLVEMDARFEPTWADIKQSNVPDLRWEICGASREDRDGHMRKTDSVGGAIADEAGEDTQPVSFRKIDTLAAKHAMQGPFFLRFDTHGAELDVLAGATETLKHTTLIQMECYNFKLDFMQGRNLTFDEMVGFMREQGFRVIDMCGPLYRKDGALWQMHLFFARADHATFRSNSFNPKPPTN